MFDGAPARTWLIRIAAIAVGPLLTAFALWRFQGPRPPGVCPRCGYDLRATPDRCPECGTVLRRVG